MTKLIIQINRSSRKKLANPHSPDTLRNRLVESGAIDLRGNNKTIDLGNGYVKITPIDETRKFT